VLANPVGRLKNGLKMHLIEVVLFFRNSCKEILEWPKGRIVYSEISFDSCLLPTNKFICFHTYSINSDYLDAEACLAKNIYFMPESHSKSAKKPIAIV